MLLAKAWNNGKFLPNGAGYGIEVSGFFRDEYLDITWPSLRLQLEGENGEVELSINSSIFWSRGRELRSIQIGKWLIKNGFATWDKDSQVEVFLTPVEGNLFKAKLQKD